MQINSNDKITWNASKTKNEYNEPQEDFHHYLFKEIIENGEVDWDEERKATDKEIQPQNFKDDYGNNYLHGLLCWGSKDDLWQYFSTFGEEWFISGLVDENDFRQTPVDNLIEELAENSYKANYVESLEFIQEKFPSLFISSHKQKIKKSSELGSNEKNEILGIIEGPLNKSTILVKDGEYKEDKVIDEKHYDYVESFNKELKNELNKDPNISHPSTKVKNAVVKYNTAFDDPKVQNKFKKRNKLQAQKDAAQKPLFYNEKRTTEGINELQEQIKEISKNNSDKLEAVKIDDLGNKKIKNGHSDHMADALVNDIENVIKLREDQNVLKEGSDVNMNFQNHRPKFLQKQFKQLVYNELVKYNKDEKGENKIDEPNLKNEKADRKYNKKIKQTIWQGAAQIEPQHSGRIGFIEIYCEVNNGEDISHRLNLYTKKGYLQMMAIAELWDAKYQSLGRLIRMSESDLEKALLEQTKNKMGKEGEKMVETYDELKEKITNTSQNTK